MKIKHTHVTSLKVNEQKGL